MTTLITGGLNDNPAFNLRRMFQAFEHQPINLGILGRAASTVPDPLIRQIESGACGLKVHEDYAGYPSVIDQALTVADAHDIQIAMHTDGINESCELHETVAAIGGRAIHAYHVEGIGGGHAPDILAIVGRRQRHRLVDHADDPLRPERRGRASRDDVVGARDEPARAERPGDDRRPHPRRDHAGGERAPRAGRDQHHQLRLPGHGADRRVDAAHLAARPPDEDAATAARPPTTMRGS